MKLQQEWDRQCAVAGEIWAFGDTNPPFGEYPHHPQGNPKRPIPIAKCLVVRMAGEVDGSLPGTEAGKTFQTGESLELARDEHETRQKALVQIDDDLNRLDENEGSVRAELSGRLQRWQESLPDPGAESLPVERLKERSELYRRKRREQTAAADELRLLQTRRQAFSEVLQRLEEESQPLSAESESIQTRLNALKADRDDRYGDLDPVRERRTLESGVDGLDAEERSLATEVEALRQGLAADREVLLRLADQTLQARTEAEAAERDILERSGAAGFGSLNEIRDGLAILQGEQEVMSRLAEAEGH